MTDKGYVDRRQALKLGAFGAFPLNRLVDSPSGSGSVQVTQAMTPAVKKGYQVIDGNEGEFNQLLVTVENTGNSPVVLADDVYVLSGVPYSATDWKVEYYSTWGPDLKANESTDVIVQGAEKINHRMLKRPSGPLEFKWVKEKEVLERAPEQFRSERRTFPDDYAQGETYTAKFGTFLKSNDGSPIPVTDSVKLRYSGGMRKVRDGDSYSIWVPKFVESVGEGTRRTRRTRTPSQTDTPEEANDTSTSEGEPELTVSGGRISNGELTVDVATDETPRPTFINSISRNGTTHKNNLMTVPIDRASNEYLRFESTDEVSSFSTDGFAGYEVRRRFGTAARTLTIETTVGVLPARPIAIVNVRFLNDGDQSVRLDTKPNFVAEGIGMGRADIRSPEGPYKFSVSGREPRKFSRSSKWATYPIAGDPPYVMAFDAERALAVGLLQGTTDERLAMTEGKPHQIRLFVNPIELAPGDNAEWTLAITAHDGGSKARNQAQQLLTTAKEHRQKIHDTEKVESKDNLPKKVIVKCRSDDMRRYKFQVTGEVRHLEPNEDHGEAVDTISGNTVKGMVGKGDDRFAFSGELIRVNNPAPVRMIVEKR